MYVLLPCTVTRIVACVLVTPSLSACMYAYIQKYMYTSMYVVVAFCDASDTSVRFSGGLVHALAGKAEVKHVRFHRNSGSSLASENHREHTVTETQQGV